MNNQCCKKLVSSVAEFVWAEGRERLTRSAKESSRAAGAHAIVMEALQSSVLDALALTEPHEVVAGQVQ